MRRVAIEIAPERVTLSVLRAAEVQHVLELPLDASSDSTSISPALNALVPAIRQWLSQHHLADPRRSDCRIILNPGAGLLAADANTIIHSGSPALRAGEAAHAVHLALESLAQNHADPLDQANTQTLLLASDRAPSDIAPLQAHYLGVNIPPQAVAFLESWTRALGLRFDGVQTALALIAPHAIRLALLHSLNKPAPAVCLCIQRDAAVLCVAASGQLRVVRLISLGLDTLAHALTRPIKLPRNPADPDQPSPLHLSTEQARDLFSRAGVPEPDQRLSFLNHSFTGASILPLLQPALQRLGLEIKQSVKFGLAEHERAAGIHSLLLSPFPVPRLDAALWSLAALHSPPSAAASSPESAQPSLPALAFAPSAIEPVLTSAAALDRLKRSILSASLVGGVLGLALVFLNASLSSRSLLQARTELAALNSAAAQRDAFHRTLNSAATESRILADLKARIDAALASPTDWASLLSLLSAITPPAVRLTSIDAKSSLAGPEVRIAGKVLNASEIDAAQHVAALLDSLKVCPLVADAQLVSTSRLQVGPASEQQFDIRLSLRTLPIESLAGAQESTHD